MEHPNAPAANSQSATIYVIEKLIEDRTLMFSKAINARSWNPEDPPWCFVSKMYFTADLTFLDRSLNGAKKGIEQTMQFWQDHCAKHPDFRLEVTDITTTVSESGKFADSWLNIDVHGEADGVVKKLVNKALWRYEMGAKDWKCANTTCYIGMSASPV